jgi:hypothetical protein
LPVPGAGLDPTDVEAELLAGARLDLQGRCGPVRDALPGNSLGAIGCSPASAVAAAVTIIALDGRRDLDRAYRDAIDADGIAFQVRDAGCDADGPVERSYIPEATAAEPNPERIACRVDGTGVTHVVLTDPPFLLLRIEGHSGASPEEVERYPFLGNRDAPGGPTLWATEPMSPEK